MAGINEDITLGPISEQGLAILTVVRSVEGTGLVVTSCFLRPGTIRKARYSLIAEQEASPNFYSATITDARSGKLLFHLC